MGNPDRSTTGDSILGAFEDLWQKVYELLGLSQEFDIFCSDQSKDFSVDPLTWAVPMIQGVTCAKVIEVFRKSGVTVFLYGDDLDTSATKNDRDPSKGSYVVRFRRSVEVEEHLNKSANHLKRGKIQSITLLERLLLGLAYFLATGSHLDQQTVTLCAGSRDSGGDVPDVSCDPTNQRLFVDWYGPGTRSSNMGARAAVL